MASLQDAIKELQNAGVEPESAESSGEAVAQADTAAIARAEAVVADLTVKKGEPLCVLSAMKMALGSLDRVDTVLKMLCMVNAVPDFKDHPKVADGMSNLFVEVFGENGRHARSAVGMGSLPNQISVEIEGVISIKA